MADKEREKTDELLEEMERKLSAIYSNARIESESSIEAYLEEIGKKIEDLENNYQEAKKNGKKKEAKSFAIKKQKYIKEMTLQSEHFRNMVAQFGADLSHVSEIAVAYMNGKVPDIYALNYARPPEVSYGMKGISFELVDAHTVKNLILNDEKLRLPLRELNVADDTKWNVKNVNSQILQGILQGESCDKIAQRLVNVERMSLNQAIRTARTLTTEAECRGRQDRYERETENGLILKRRWIATNDKHTRDAHRQLQGVEVDVDKPFTNELGEIMYPGDPNAVPANVYNCRCSISARVVGYNGKNNTKSVDLDNEILYNNTVKAAYPEYSRIFPGNSGAEVEASRTNPNYSSGKYEYRNNCQRCVPAWETRMRGFDVQAMPCKPKGEDDPFSTSPFSVWNFNLFDPDPLARVQKDREGNGKEKIIEYLLKCGSGARVEIVVDWDASDYSHAFAAVNKNGKIIFVDPQTGQSGEVVEDYFYAVTIGKTTWLRIDNKSLRESAREEIMRSAYE